MKDYPMQESEKWTRSSKAPQVYLVISGHFLDIQCCHDTLTNTDKMTLTGKQMTL